MKRFTVLGLCLTAAFALSVVLAASAQAGSEHGNVVIHASGLEAHLGLSNGVEVHSSSNSGSGEFTSGTSGTSVSTFLGVQQEPGAKKCKSGSEPSGTVKTEPLTEGLGWIAKPGSAGADFKAAGTYLAVFSCEGGTEFKVTGSVIGHIGPLNSIEPKGTLKLEGAGFKNEPEAFEPPAPSDFLESSINGAPALHSGQFQTDTTEAVTKCKPPKKGKPEKCKGTKTVEISTLYNPAQPEIGHCNKLKGGKFSEKTCTGTPEPGKGKYEFYPAGT
jgi:hypothetical protein